MIGNSYRVENKCQDCVWAVASVDGVNFDVPLTAGMEFSVKDELQCGMIEISVLNGIFKNFTLTLAAKLTEKLIVEI